MYERFFAYSRRSGALVGVLALLGVLAMLSAALTGCESTAQLRNAHLQEDSDTCADFGTRYGSPEHSQCMLVQQQRRDNKGTDALERSRIASETASNNLEMVRKMRCDRQAKQDRKNGVRPRPCR